MIIGTIMAVFMLVVARHYTFIVDNYYEGLFMIVYTSFMSSSSHLILLLFTFSIILFHFLYSYVNVQLVYD